MPTPHLSRPDPLPIQPIPKLLLRTKRELGADFDFSKPSRVSRAPGRLDVMGGIADYTGSLVCEATLACAAATVLQQRDDREIQVMSFNMLDNNEPFTFRMNMSDMGESTQPKLREEFAQPGRKWAGYLAGCMFALHKEGLLDLNDSKLRGLNLAVYSTVPMGAGVSSSAAIEVATMMNMVDHYGLCDVMDPLKLASLCQWVENQIVGAPCGIMDQVTSCFGEAGAFQRIVCQPHQLLPYLFLPHGFRVIGINSKVKHSVGGPQYGMTRCAAFMGHAIILGKMREMGKAQGKELIEDPMHGYLANLDQDDYKKYFRPYLPEKMQGSQFLSQYTSTIDKATSVQNEKEYHVLQATDHHVLEARRVRQFCEFLEAAGKLDPKDDERYKLMDKAGHLMYASHLSYTNDALLGADECDLLVQLVREREKSGLYGARITGGGCGGTVAVLCEANERADAAIAEIMQVYEQKTGKQPDAFKGTSRGAWHYKSSLTSEHDQSITKTE